MTDKNVEALLQEVIDREAIRDLVTRYCHVVWREDFESYPALFTEDGVVRWTNSDQPPVQGRAALREMIEGLVTAHRPRHFIHNHIVQLLGPDRATGQCCLEDSVWLDGGVDGLLVAYYEDEYVKLDGEWKFKVRQVTLEYFGPRADYTVPAPSNNKG